MEYNHHIQWRMTLLLMITNAYVNDKFLLYSNDRISIREGGRRGVITILHFTWRGGESERTCHWDGANDDGNRRRLHPLQGLRLLLPYHENNQSNWVKMYTVFLDHLDIHNGIMNIARLPICGAGKAAHAPAAPGDRCVIEHVIRGLDTSPCICWSMLMLRMAAKLSRSVKWSLSGALSLQAPLELDSSLVWPHAT